MFQPVHGSTWFLYVAIAIEVAVAGIAALQLVPVRGRKYLIQAITFLGGLHLYFGVALLGVDLAAGMPWYWTAMEGPGIAVFGGVYLGFVAWSVWLLLIGVRTVHGWTWGRAAATVALAAAFPALIVAATSL